MAFFQINSVTFQTPPPGDVICSFQYRKQGDTEWIVLDPVTIPPSGVLVTPFKKTGLLKGTTYNVGGKTLCGTAIKVVNVTTPANVPPTAHAGANQTIQSPTNTVNLAGTGTDTDGTIVGYLWTKLSGPACVITTPNAADTSVTGLATAGVYVFQLTVTDNDGATGTDTVNIVVEAATISWEGINPFCETAPSCGAGYALNPDHTLCVHTDSTPATPPSGGGGTPGTVGKVNNAQWNNGGGLVYAPGYGVDGSGTIAQALTRPHLWVNGDAQWSTATRNTVDSRMNVGGIWVQGQVSNPVNEWIGFSRKIVTATPKTVYIGMCADNTFKFRLNGVDLIIIPDDGVLQGGPNFNFIHLFPVNLPAGNNYIEMFAKNTGSVAGFAAEIYDMTLQQLIDATTEADLTLLFSTKDMVGEEFDLGQTIGWSCASGWVLDTSGAGDPVCRHILTAAPTLSNTGIKGFTNRRRLNNGVPDGYSEANTNGTGIGPYIAPAEDLAACPLP